LRANSPFHLSRIQDRGPGNISTCSKAASLAPDFQETTMIKMSKFALVAALVAVSVASPALAQSFNPRDGTGNVMPLQYQTDGGRTAWTGEPGKQQVNAQVAARKNNASQIAAHQGRSLERVAGHRTVHHGAA
jgi:hypothetical protein